MSTTTKRHIGKKYKILFIVIAVLILIRLILPSIVLHYANKTLANVPGYYGHVEDIDLSIYRGAYQLNNMYLNKLDSVTGKQTPFFKVETIDLSIEWRALFHGSIAGRLTFYTPSLLFTKNKTEIGQVKKDTNDFRKVLRSFMPLKVNRFDVNNGNIHYIDETSNPKVDIAMTHTHILAENLTNVVDKKKELPSSVVANADVYGGKLSFNMRLNGLAAHPTFDLNAELKNTNLVLLNDFLKAYGGFDVERGDFGLYTEFASKDGVYTGYVKPVIKDLKVLGPHDKHDNILQLAWEAIVGAAGVILRNQHKDQIATKVPISGDLKTSSANIPESIWELLRNAFIQALVPNIDNQISINSVGKAPEKKQSLFQKIFSKKDNK
jgi:hypothetical protein